MMRDQTSDRDPGDAELRALNRALKILSPLRPEQQTLVLNILDSGGADEISAATKLKNAFEPLTEQARNRVLTYVGERLNNPSVGEQVHAQAK